MRKIVWILFFCTSLLSTLHAQTVLNANFEDGDRTVGGALNLNNIGLACADDCMRVLQVGGNNVIRSVVRPTDANCGNSKRCEAQVFKTGADTAVKNKHYGFDANYINYDSVVSNHNETSFQFKTKSGDSYPIVALWETTVAGVVRWQLRITVDTTSTDNATAQETVIDLGPVISNQFIRWEFDINWIWTHAGYIRVYRNGVFVNAYNGATMNKPHNINNPAYPPLRFGIYAFGYGGAGPFTAPWRQVYYDNIAIGNSELYNNVERLFRSLFK
jgi:hypothetical protein